MIFGETEFEADLQDGSVLVDDERTLGSIQRASRYIGDTVIRSNVPFHDVNHIPRLGIHTERSGCSRLADVTVTAVGFGAADGDSFGVCLSSPALIEGMGLPVYGFGRKNAQPSYFGDIDSNVQGLDSVGVIITDLSKVSIVMNPFSFPEPFLEADQREVSTLTRILASALIGGVRDKTEISS